MLRNLEFEIKSIIYSRVWIIFRRVLRKVAWNDKIGSMEWNRIVYSSKVSLLYKLV